MFPMEHVANEKAAAVDGEADKEYCFDQPVMAASCVPVEVPSLDIPCFTAIM